MKYLISLLLLFSLDAKAESFYKYGVAIFDNEAAKADALIFSGGYQNRLLKTSFTYQLEVGYWSRSKSKPLSKEAAFYFSGSIGVEVESTLLYGSSFWGIGVVSNTDYQLSTHYQFFQDLTLGIGTRARFIGVNYKHISNAGVMYPKGNKGRDFLMAVVRIPLHW